MRVKGRLGLFENVRINIPPDHIIYNIYKIIYVCL